MEKSPFVERLLKKGYEVLFLVEPVDEYCIQSLPEFEGKKFQNVAKEGVKIDQSEKAKEYHENLEKDFEPLIKWLKETALKDQVGTLHNKLLFPSYMFETIQMDDKKEVYIVVFAFCLYDGKDVMT